MQPLALRNFCVATSLGVGREPTVSALRANLSGLRPCALEPALLPTYVGAVPWIDDVRPDGAVARFHRRNNRLAAMGLGQDGFAASVAAARERYGPERIGVFVGTSTSGLLQTESAYRRRDPASGRLPADFDYARTHSTYSLG